MALDPYDSGFLQGSSVFTRIAMLASHSISDVFGFASMVCWLCAQLPQVIENIRHQSSEGLALPFLANWFLGDISNLVGCVLTHQLPFQTYLATYFVFVDCILLVQYFYYYKPTKVPPAPHTYLRSTTIPAAGRRISIDRGASRYRTLSAVASNVAASAALAAMQDEGIQPTSLYSHRSRPRQSMCGDAGQPEDRDSPSAMMASFYSEGGYNSGPKRVSWSIERQGDRAASVGHSVRRPPVLNFQPVDRPTSSQSRETVRGEVPFPQQLQDPSMDSPSPTIVSAKGTRAARRGSALVFLSAWALFGLQFLTNGHETTNSGVGRVLSSVEYIPSVPVALESKGIYSPDNRARDLDNPGLFLPGFPAPSETRDPVPPQILSKQVLGRIFAWLCTTLYLTSRLPQIWKNYVRKSVEGLSIYLFVFAFLGNTFYVASILLSPRRFLPPPEASKYIRETIPYLLGSGGTLMFDITIVSQSFCYRPRQRRLATSSYVRVLDEEEAGLLSHDSLAPILVDSTNILHRGRTARNQGST